jgi:hypothetical protein
MAQLELPLDPEVINRLRDLGKELVTNADMRDGFLAAPESHLEEMGLRGIQLGELDRKVLEMLSEPDFQAALSARDTPAIRKSFEKVFAMHASKANLMGIWDFDFDVEVEVEVVFVAVAIAVFDLAAAKATMVTPEELMKRRRILSAALQRLEVTRLEIEAQLKAAETER